MDRTIWKYIYIAIPVLLIVTIVLVLVFRPKHKKMPGLDQNIQFYAPGPTNEARQYIASLTAAGDYLNANLVQKMVDSPHAVWMTGGSPDMVRQRVEQIALNAASAGRVPVFVAYNIPYRDCGDYSSGGAAGVMQYRRWIEAFAEGIGNYAAIVILEPDSLGTIPYFPDLNGKLGKCRFARANRFTAAGDRFNLLNDAVTTFKKLPNVHVYLDATQVRWLSVGDAAYRLVRAGVMRADGFALNISNFQLNEDLIKYGTWISKCIWYVEHVGPHSQKGYKSCASQYSPAKLDDKTTWALTDQWYAEHVENQKHYPGNSELVHFVIDTSRNGRGRWVPPDGVYRDAEDWCNPPGRGLGNRSTANTGVPLLDAYLWIKIPGESDGQCTRGLGKAGKAIDPEWKLVDPISGTWFPEMALTLATNANPPLK